MTNSSQGILDYVRTVRSNDRRDPYLLGLGALWLSVPWTALHFWLAWDQLPLRMATHFDDKWRANGWSSRADAVTFAFATLGFALVIVTPSCYVTRARKPRLASRRLLALHDAPPDLPVRHRHHFGRLRITDGIPSGATTRRG